MFDPYHRWLAIPPRHRPPTYYQLLGIASDEADPEVIREAALRQVNHIRTYQTGPHAQVCQALLNEIGQARVTLLNPEKRKDYDARLGIGTGEDEDRETEGPQDNIDRPSVPPSFSLSGLKVPVLLYLFLVVLGGFLAFWLAFTVG